MMRIVLDTNILTAGLRSRDGASFAILRLVSERRLRPLITTALFLEYEAVLKRPDQIAVHGRSEAELNGALAEFAALAEPVEVHFRWRPQLPDPKDEMVLEAVVNGRADALVTHNIKDFSNAIRRFRMKAFRPSEFLKELKT